MRAVRFALYNWSINGIKAANSREVSAKNIFSDCNGFRYHSFFDYGFSF